MNPAIISSLLKVVGRFAAVSAAEKLTKNSGGDGVLGPAREMAESFIGRKKEERERASESSNVPHVSREEDLRKRLASVVASQGERDNGSRPFIRPELPPQDAHHVVRQAEEDEEGKKAVKSFSDKAKDFAQKLAGVAGPVGLVGAAAIGTHKALQAMATGVLAMNKHLAQYSGNLAQTYAEADVSQMNRDVAKAKAMERPTSQLSAASNAAKDSLAGPMNNIATIASTILAVALRASTAVIEFIYVWTGAKLFLETTAWACEKILDIMEWWYGKQQEVDDSLPPWSSFFADVSDGKFDGKRPTFTGPKNLHSDQNMKDIFGK